MLRDNEEYLKYLATEKWKRIAEQRRNIDDNKCQCCGTRGTKTNPLEVHHLSYKHIGNEEGRIYEDLVTLCYSCHKGLHCVMNRITSPSGRRGWQDNKGIPQVSVYRFVDTLGGCKVVNKNEIEQYRNTLGN